MKKLEKFTHEYLEERRAHTRQHFPPALIKFAWKEVDKYHQEIQEKVTRKLSSKKMPNTHLSFAQRYDLMAEKLEIYIHYLENGLNQGRFERNEKNIKLLSYHYHMYASALVQANKLGKADEVFKGMLKKKYAAIGDYAFMGELYFLKKDYSMAINFFKRINDIDSILLPIEAIMVNYYYGVSLLNTGNPTGAIIKLTRAYDAMKNNDAIAEPLTSLCKRQLKKAKKAAVSSAPSPKTF
jgi:tetratricopeptide (TPR) repeat protein